MLNTFMIFFKNVRFIQARTREKFQIRQVKIETIQKLWEKTFSQLMYKATLNKDTGMKAILNQIVKVKATVKTYVIS